MKASLRTYPYPYRALFTVCSDLDETPNEAIYFETLRYLNTDQETKIGKGVNLEIGNTIYFRMPEDQFSYWNCTDAARMNIQKLIHSGHIDCLHSFGDFVNDRASALSCLTELEKHDCKIKVWIDHAQAPSNFDPDIMQGSGAEKDSEVYHADITIGEYGVKYVWKGRVTSVISQNNKRNLGGIVNMNFLKASFKTLLNEFAKGILGRLGSKKYKMHSDNRVLRGTTLADGTSVIEFMRSNPSWAGVSVFDKGRDIANVLTEKMIDRLVQQGGCSILYTHLGKIHSIDDPFGKDGRKAFEMLSRRQAMGDVLVTTTRRLLDYLCTRDALQYRVRESNGRCQIHVDLNGVEINELSGMTWYVEDPESTDVFIDGKKVEDVTCNPMDSSMRRSISLPFQKLSFPELAN